MPQALRKWFPYVMLLLAIAGVGWAINFSELPPADFTFDNGSEIQTIDQARATGEPENRIINACFEGLLSTLPEAGWEQKYPFGENVPVSPQPAAAERFEVSEDGRVYTFHIRKSAKWSDGSPVTAHDFTFSWMRTLHPETASQYSFQLHYLVGALEYNTAVVKLGDPLEIELDLPASQGGRRDPIQLFPRSKIVRGQLVRMVDPAPLEHAADVDADTRAAKDAKHLEARVFIVNVAEPGAGEELRAFSLDVPRSQKLFSELPIEPAHHVLPDFEKTVGVKALDDHTLEVTLINRTAYFPALTAFYPLYPVNRKCVETFGSPDWTKPENIVGNGPFKLQFRRIRDRIRLVKSDTYWDAANVKLNIIDALAIKSETTALNLYLKGNLDWATIVPAATIPTIKKDYADQFHTAPQLTVYFYRINTTHPSLKNPKLRKALSLAIDKQNIVEFITKAGESPAWTIVPPGLTGYEGPPPLAYDIAQAKALLAEAGYPDGSGLPPIEILYNDVDLHRTIAERIQQMWRQNLGIEAKLRGLEWGVYLDAQQNLAYQVCRAGWVADYPDPNTFLDLWTSENTHNQTGWKNPAYDKLIAAAAIEADTQKRMSLFRDAEKILLEECPILPVYFYVSKNMVKTRVKGFCPNVLNYHPLKIIRIEEPAAASAAIPGTDFYRGDSAVISGNQSHRAVAQGGAR